MPQPLFFKNTLVEYTDRIYEVIEQKLVEDSSIYKLKLIAFLKNETTSIDYIPKHILFEDNIEEKSLKEFNHKHPKYSFNERVRFTTDSYQTHYALVKYIKFENHSYMYRLIQESRKDEGVWLNYGHLIEESYISK